MDNFKLDLTQLTPVEEKDRIKGNWYVVSDDMSGYSYITQYDEGQYSIVGEIWLNWFLIPHNLPGFPEAELPDEMWFNGNDWTFSLKSGGVRVSRIKPNLPEISIPSGTKSEQVAKLRKILEELENGK